MNKITSYKELVIEQARLENELRLQKLTIRTNIKEVQEELKPLLSLLPVLRLLKEKKPVAAAVQGAANVGVDILSSVVLARSGWIVRLLVPRLLKFIAKYSLGKRVPSPAIDSNAKLVDER